MPKLSTFGLVQNVTPVGPGTRNAQTPYHVADSDTVVSIQKTPVGATFVVQLPGPTSSPNNLPNNGDWYAVGDPLGQLVGGHTLTVDGGGFPIQGNPTIILAFAGEAAEFTFDDAAQAWIVCFCGQRD